MCNGVGRIRRRRGESVTGTSRWRGLLASILTGLVVTAAVSLAADAAVAWAWHAQPMPGNAAVSVSCATTRACQAVGQASHGKTFAVGWNGRRWTHEPSRSPVNSALGGVSCISATRCEAVGERHNATGGVLAEGWTGRHWAVQAATNHAYWTLQGVSCVSSTFCGAVGQRDPGPVGTGSSQSLVEGWNGHRWAQLPAPSAPNDELISVSCTALSFCVAVGASGGLTHTRVEQWNGRAWARGTAPGPVGEFLTGVSCPSATQCIAVGGDRTNDSQVVLIDRMLAGHWTRQAGAASQSGFLRGVSCPTTRWCVTVGSAFIASGSTYPGLVELWNGSTWTRQLLQPGAGFVESLYDASCRSSSFCEVVGGAPRGAEGWR